MFADPSQKQHKIARSVCPDICLKHLMSDAFSFGFDFELYHDALYFALSVERL